MNKIEKAENFAQEKHKGQIRKYTGQPYYVHCEEVARLVSTVTSNEDMIIAALLHDTIENTNTSYQEIKSQFGSIVADYVISLTDTSKLIDGNRENRESRKKIDRDKFESSTLAVKTIKMADLIDNTESIIIHDPDFAKVYMREKALLFDVLVNNADRADWRLSQIAYNIILEFYKIK